MDLIQDYLQSTMLIERLFGVSVYTVVLGYFYKNIQHARDNRKIAGYLNRYLLVLCIMAFFYVPGANADLTRWRLLAEPWMDASFSWFWNYRLLRYSSPAGYLLIYLCQKTGIQGLLPMVCAFGFFLNAFHILKCESKRPNRSSDSIAVALLFLMSGGVFLEAISGVRCMLGFSIVFRCVYDEQYENKRMLWNFPFYFIAAILHIAVIPILGIRFFCALFEKKRMIVSTFLGGILTAGGIGLGFIFGNDYVEAAFQKATTYLNEDVYSFFWEYVIGVFSLAVVAACIWKLRKRYSPGKEEKNTMRFLVIMLAVEVLTFATYSIFHRFAVFSVFLNTPILLSTLGNEEICGRRRFRQMVIVASIIILAVACTRGNLCGYKFFLL